MSESRVVSAGSVMELLAEVKRLLAEGWKVKGVSAHDADADLYTQEMVK